MEIVFVNVEISLPVYICMHMHVCMYTVASSKKFPIYTGVFG